MALQLAFIFRMGYAISKMNALNSKFIIPKRREICSRKRLVSLFDDNPDKKMFVVTAGAGFGKTTFVVDALSRTDLDCAWYRLDEQDTDFQVFLTHLYALIHYRFPEKNKDAFKKQIPSGIEENTRALLKWLTFLQENIHSPIVIIFDDYHLVQESQAINEAVDFIQHRLPELVKLVIIGRKKLPLALSRMRVQQSLVEIDEADLCFSNSEIELFFQNHVQMEKPNIVEIQNATRGWAASLVLLKQALSQQPDIGLAENLSRFTRKSEGVFSYLEENVFDLQPVHIREFMMKMALLPEIDASKCREIFGVEDADKILRQILEDHLMIFPVDESGTVFILHHLFRDFLFKKLAACFSVDEISQFHCRIAESFKNSDIDLALQHFVSGRDYSKAVQIIEENEMDFLLRGKVQFLDRILKQIPEEIVAENPQILLSQSRICSHFGDPEKSIALTSKALKQLQHKKQKDKILDCVVELGMQYYYTGHLKEAKLMMEQVLENIEKESPTYVMAMTFLTFLPSILGEFETSRKYEREARKVVSEYAEFEKQVATLLLDTSLTHTLFFMGDFEYSQQVSLKLLDEVLQLNIEPCLPLVYYQLSVNSFFLGNSETGCSFAEKGVDICEKMTISDSRKAWNHLAWAQNYMESGQLEKAQEQLDISIGLFETPGNRWGLASAQECQAQIYLEQGRVRPALRILENALDLIKGYGLNVTSGILENRYAQTLIAENKHQESLTFLSSARSKLEGSAFHLFNNYLLSAQVFWQVEQTDAGLSYLSKAFRLSQKFKFSRYVIQNRAWLIPLYFQTKNQNHPFLSEIRGYIEKLFQNEIITSAQELKVDLFGQFDLSIGSRRLDSSDWKSSKALMLLKYLAANQRQGYIPKDFLIELLWPEQDPVKTGSRFNMAMSALRKTLEPGIAPKAACIYIDRKKDTYRLNTDLCRVDLDLFWDYISKAGKAPAGSLKALDFYIKACQIYKGPFLEEDLYEQWCVEKRHIVLQQYIDALQAVIELSGAQNLPEQAITYSQKLLVVSPMDETAVFRLMTYFSQTGANSKAIKVYEAYLFHTEELDLPADEKITSLFQNLVRI